MRGGGITVLEQLEMHRLGPVDLSSAEVSNCGGLELEIELVEL